MSSFSYNVCCRFADADLVEPWLEWLRNEHLADVLAAGALDAEVVQFDGVPTVCEVRYHFADSEAFAAYERDHAERLRSEGLRKFPLASGLSYTRQTGLVVASLRSAEGTC